MNKTLELLLQLEGLVLVKNGIQLAGPQAEGFWVDELDERISKLRHQLPGRVLSLFDGLMRRYPDPVTVLAEGVCQGCHQPNSPRSQRPPGPNHLLRCKHCGRFLFAAQDAPDYVP